MTTTLLYTEPDVEGIVEEWMGQKLRVDDPIENEEQMIRTLTRYLIVVRNIIRFVFNDVSLDIRWAQADMSATDLKNTVMISPKPVFDERMTVDQKFCCIAWSAAHEAGELYYNTRKTIEAVDAAETIYGVDKTAFKYVINIIGDMFINDCVIAEWPGIKPLKQYAYHKMFREIDQIAQEYLEFTLDEHKTRAVANASRETLAEWAWDKFKRTSSFLVACLKTDVDTSMLDSKMSRLVEVSLKYATEDLGERITGTLEVIRIIMDDEVELLKLPTSGKGKENKDSVEAASKEGDGSGDGSLNTRTARTVNSEVEKIESSRATKESGTKKTSAVTENEYSDEPGSTKLFTTQVPGAANPKYGIKRKEYKGGGKVDVSILDLKAKVEKEIGPSYSRIMWKNKRLSVSSVVGTSGYKFAAGKGYRLAYGDPRILNTTGRTKPEKVDLLLVVDKSGSMSGEFLGKRKYMHAREAAMVLFVLFQKTGVVRPWVFTHFFRDRDVITERIITPQNSSSDGQLQCFSKITAEGANADGIAAASIFEEFLRSSTSNTKICYWIADGLPSADTDYSGRAATLHTADVMKTYRRKIDITGILIDIDNREGVENAGKIFGSDKIIPFTGTKAFINLVINKINK